MKHGLWNHPLYRTWLSMKQRCYSPAYQAYPDYGGRGITICEQWRTDVVAFYTWAISHGWQAGLSIERINNNGNYSPDNCCFIPLGRQQWNTRQTKIRPEQVPTIRQRAAAGDKHASIAEDYNVNRSTITMIVTRRNYKDIP